MRTESIICPLCDGERTLFYWEDGGFHHSMTKGHSIVGTCWLCEGKGTMSSERDKEFQEWSAQRTYPKTNGKVTHGSA